MRILPIRSKLDLERLIILLYTFKIQFFKLFSYLLNCEPTVLPDSYAFPN